MLLKNKVALITGVASGIGRAAAHLFAQHGASIVGVDYNDPGGRETIDDIRQGSGDGIFVHADVGKKQDVDASIEAAVQRYGRIDTLFSNAASFARGALTQITEEQWDRTLDICLKATWRYARGIVPIMRDHGGGTIVITGSVHAIRGFADYSAYDTAKGGLLALTRSLAADCAPTIRVNSILPGAVITGLWEKTPESQRKRYAEMCLLKRNGVPEDIAQAALFLASDMSSYMTGASIVVDGGMTAFIDTAHLEDSH
jgi:meso-butanediol dehydrogenase / (S,S)-butanediol dehydrogenase / diacetyl reductase